MSNEDIIRMISTFEEKFKVTENRLKNLESENKAQRELILSVRELSYNVKDLVIVTKEQGERISALESEPGKKWKSLAKTMLTVIVSVIATALATGLIQMISKH